MHIHRWQRRLNIDRPLALTIGNFDGVHRGHQRLLAVLREYGAAHGCDSALMSFFPHPRSIVQGRPPALLSTLRDRACWLRHFGLDHWILLSFTRRVRELSPEAFLREYLARFPIKYLLVGDDFRFGYRGAGNFEWLAEQAPRYGFTVDAISSVCSGEDERISSSLIRKALDEHDLARAEMLLGHPLTLTGRVRRGYGRGGSHLARPTANIHLPGHWCLPDGVYVVKIAALSAGAAVHWGVANIGAAPTFGVARRRLEVHVLDAAPVLYDQFVQVSVSAYLRDIRTFADAGALRQQIEEDIAQARRLMAAQAAS
ncbi:MAG: riboflavin biosynthesis protein RibF [Cardiobacteriaceae bacterium]|nr:riboflavin biosynthesis protein RibF [Cardiobacteriaceae bacterium]